MLPLEHCNAARVFINWVSTNSISCGQLISTDFHSLLPVPPKPHTCLKNLPIPTIHHTSSFYLCNQMQIFIFMHNLISPCTQPSLLCTLLPQYHIKTGLPVIDCYMIVSFPSKTEVRHFKTLFLVSLRP